MNIDPHAHILDRHRKSEDPYLKNYNVVSRILREWLEHGKLVVAYDFDGTVYDYHNQGHTFHQVTELLHECKELGAYFIVFTAAGPDRYDSIKEYLNRKEIPFDAINENMPGLPFGNEGNKIYYNVLLDDRAGLRSAYEDLWEAVKFMKMLKSRKEED
jgi:FMN phosphatase YigB (HAD superfamily)